MGATEAYIGAGLFHIFGSSVFTLRLGLIVLVTLFLVSTYLLANLLYTKKLALFSLVLLGLGSDAMLTRQLTAIGGYPETLLFGSLAFLLATWLAFTCRQGMTQRERWIRYLGYGCWGLVVGLGLWSDLLIIPFVLMSGSLVLLFCWRDVRTLAPVFLLLGLFVGAFPLIVYNLGAPPGQDSLSVLWSLQHADAGVSHSLQAQIKSAIQVSLPTATGSPFCLGSELALFGPPVPHTRPCTIFQTSWGGDYIVLWAIAVLLSLGTLWSVRHQIRSRALSHDESQALIRQCARLLLLGSAGLALLFYVLSPSSVVWPSVHSRYLIGLLIAAPAVIWPLWSGAGKFKLPLAQFANVKAAFCSGVLLFLGIAFLLGTINVFSEIPSAQTTNQQQDALVNNLLRIGATHIYTDYWTCDRIAFVSNEKIICGIIDDNLQPNHNRYYPYYLEVKADPHAAYVYPLDFPERQNIVRKVHLSSGNYQQFVFDGYVVYQPRAT